jgi:phage shock protein C
MSPYSLNRRDKKLAGVASTVGELFNIDPTFIRIGFVVAALMISWKLALVAYVAGYIYLRMARGQALRQRERKSEYDRMDDVGKGRSSIHALRTTLDTNDRRMMAIDQHLNRHNDELAREIEALRGDR